MTPDQVAIFLILAATLALFSSHWIRYDLVAMGALMACVLTGVVDVDTAFRGFGHPAVITVACVLIISRALGQAGLAEAVGRLLRSLPDNRCLLLLTLCGICALLSAFMNNAGALALMMPIALMAARDHRLAPSLLLMPLSFASLLGGMSTLIGTPPNIIVAEFRAQSTGAAFDMFDFTTVGLAVAVCGIGFMVLIGHRLLPTRAGATGEDELFHAGDYISELHVPRGSRLVGKTIDAIEHLTSGSVGILAVMRANNRIVARLRHEPLAADDVLLIQADARTLKEVVARGGLELIGDLDLRKESQRGELTIAEAVIPSTSILDGMTPEMMRLRSTYNINLLGVAREGNPFLQRLRALRLRAGDVLLIQGYADSILTKIRELGCVPLSSQPHSFQSARLGRTFAVFAAGIAAAASNLLTLPTALVLVVLGLLSLRCLSPKDLYTGIEWTVIVLVGAMIPVGLALHNTGATELIAVAITALAGDGTPLLLLFVLMLATLLLTDIINNAATATIMAPIAIRVAEASGLSADPFLIGVALAASSAFLTPIGHQNNTLILGPGGYRFTDYWRLGLPIDLIVLAVALVAIPRVWAF